MKVGFPPRGKAGESGCEQNEGLMPSTCVYSPEMGGHILGLCFQRKESFVGLFFPLEILFSSPPTLFLQQRLGCKAKPVGAATTAAVG